MLTIFFEDMLVVFFILLLLILPFVWWRVRQRLKYLQKLARINILKRQQKMDGNQIYISFIISSSVTLLYFSFSAAAGKALKELVGGRVAKACRFLAHRYNVLAVLLSAHQNAKLAFKKLKKQKLWDKGNRRLVVFYPLTALQIFEHRQAQIWLEQISRSKLYGLGRAYLDYADTHTCIYNGDMAAAAKNIQHALKIFRRRHYVVEEAACYMKLAEIYRLSCMNDMAFAMLSAAADIYEKLQTPLYLAAAVAAKGMLMLFENRYDEAAAFYEQAQQLAPTEKMKADITNQQALLNLSIGKLYKAQKQVRQTKNFYQKISNNIGLAFSLQLEGQIAYEQAHYHKSVIVLQQAADLYFRQHNYTAYAESAYGTANGLCKLGKYAVAESVLQRLLQHLRQHDSAFHIANIYSLLGLINMETDNLPIAEKWLQKSLTLEQKDNRYTGAATDAVNLAVIKQLEGNVKQAHQYSEQALDFAIKTEDKQFIELIKNKMLH